ncbi:MAG: DnaJ C-terminal domain-containing protein [Pseudomonadota bacterium]
MAKKDYYAILNIDPKASLKEVKSAYRQMALKHHPDHNPDDPNAADNFATIREAYETLSSPAKRKTYDFDYTPRPRPKAQPRPQSSGPKPPGEKPDKNLRYNLYVTLEDVAKGCQRTIRYIRNNNGEKETVQLTVKVPKGAFQNQRLKLSGYGHVSKSRLGDLFVIIHLQPHPIFLKDQLNLRVNVPITYLDAALGSTIEVPTLSGLRKIKLKSCEFDQLSQVIQGGGLPDSETPHRGDLLVYFFIEHPKRLSQPEKNAMLRGLRAWPQGEMMQQYKLYLNDHKRTKS